MKHAAGATACARLLAVVYNQRPGMSVEFYRLATVADLDACSNVAEALEKLEQETLLRGNALVWFPTNSCRQMSYDGFSVPLYGMECWGDLFSPRQHLPSRRLYVW